jgi:myosin heavy subunit
MQIQYNITRIEEWCKSHDMPEGTLQLEHLMQATKLLQLKKVGGFFRIRILRYLDSPNCTGNGRRHRDHLRRLLDAKSHANSTHVHKLLCR